MKPAISNTGLLKCGRCRRTLPPDSFYRHARTGRADRYCKDCRNAYMRSRRKRQETPPRRLAREAGRTLITDAADREERLRLIIEALHTVRERADRCLRKRRMREAAEEGQEKDFHFSPE